MSNFMNWLHNVSTITLIKRCLGVIWLTIAVCMVVIIGDAIYDSITGFINSFSFF